MKEKFEEFARTKGATYFEIDADGVYRDDSTRLLREVWDAAKEDFQTGLDKMKHVKDLNRPVKFAEGCDCGCNTPSFTEPWDALRFLMHRMDSAGVGHAVGQSYAWDIMQILKAHDQVEPK